MIPSTLEIKKIDASYAQELSELLLQSGTDYSKYFIPFSFDFESVSKVLSKAVKDMFYGIFASNKLVGFYMLRGWDEGYEIPSYGVWVSPDFSSKGLSRLTLQHAITVCRINSIKKLMLKVHPENLIAKKIYEDFGFICQGTDERIGNLIYFKEIK